jgi:hypothetical protein
VAGTYKRPPTSQALGEQGVGFFFWASGLNMVKPRTSEEQECEGNRRFLQVALRTSPFPLVLSQSLRSTSECRCWRESDFHTVFRYATWNGRVAIYGFNLLLGWYRLDRERVMRSKRPYNDSWSGSMDY